MADFIHSDSRGIIVTTNKIALPFDMDTIEKYIKESDNIDSNDVSPPQLSQSKSYLKILGISYSTSNTSSSITHNQVKEIIKRTHLFNNITFASCPCIIKAFLKSDIAVI